MCQVRRGDEGMNEQEEAGIITTIVKMSKFNRLYYEEHVRLGFTEEQALELVKVHGMGMRLQQG